MADMTDFIVVADAIWHSGEGKTYLKGQTISLPASTKVGPGSSVMPAERVKKDKPDKPEKD